MSQDPNTQNPMAGQEPVGAPVGFPNNGSAPAGQGYNNGAFPTAPAANTAPQGNYQTGAPLAEPKQHALSVKLLWAMVALSVIGGLLTLLNLDPIVDAAIADQNKQGAQITPEMRDTVRNASLVGGIIGLIIGAGLPALFIFFWSKGRNWARIVLTVLAVFSLIGLPSAFMQIGTAPLPSIFSILSTIVFLAAMVLAWNKDVTAWVNSRKAVPAGM